MMCSEHLEQTEHWFHHPDPDRGQPFPFHPEVFMNRIFAIVITFLLSFPLMAEPSAREIIRKMEDLTRGNTSESQIIMTIQRPRFTRTMEIESWGDERDDKAFIKILRPKKDHGVTFLKVKNNMWQYIPSIGKEIKIEGSLLQDSWMGSDFTNDDLMRATSTIDDYTHEFAESDSPDNYRVVMIPKPEAPVIWSRVIVDVRKKDFLPVRQNFYDHHDRLKKVMSYSDYKSMDGRIIPTKYVMHSIHDGKEKSRTTIEFSVIRFNRPIAESVFSKANLRR